MDLLGSAAEDAETAVVLVTHDRLMAERWAGRVLAVGNKQDNAPSSSE
jgi:ABC-type lipoprotein export system ATPase subunit